MQRLEVTGAVRPIYGSLGVKQLRMSREQFFELLSKVKPYTEKQDTNG